MSRTNRKLDTRGGPTLTVFIVALTVALTVAAAVASPEDLRLAAVLIAPAITGAIASAIATRLLVVKRLRRSLLSTKKRLSMSLSTLEDELTERSALREFGRALDTASDEPAAIEVAQATFRRLIAPLSVELHLVDRTDPVLSLVFSVGDHEPLTDDRPSPWISLAGRTTSTLVYDTTDDPDVCPHLSSRLDEPVSAVAVPLTIGGCLMGVLYAFGPNGDGPGRQDVAYLEDLTVVLAARLAVIRSTAKRRSDEAIDRLTGLPDRAATQRRLLAMIDDRRSFTVAVADIDGLDRINDSAGRDIGDRCLEILAATARRAVRPTDVVGRIGGDEILFIFPDTGHDDAVRALERLREDLILALAAAGTARFTLSIGVISSSYGGPIDTILVRAADALRYAKKAGGNRVVLAPMVEAESAP